MKDALTSDYGKMGLGVLRYSDNQIVAVIDSTCKGESILKVTNISSDAKIIDSIEEAKNLGAEVLILGTAPSGGRIPESWHTPISKAINLGMSIVNGLHDFLKPQFNHLLKGDQWIWDIRQPNFIPQIATAKAANLNNNRILLVGTDMAVGKMTTGLELYKAISKKGKSCGFVATGQIGITITGEGIPLDAFKVDHACGAVETEVMKHKEKEVIIIEGQGALLHPGSTATLPLMRGSCATHLILCHRADMTTLRKPTHITIPNLKEYIKLNEDLTGVCGALKRAKTIAVSLNTSKLNYDDALLSIKKIEEETGLPTTDVIRFGVDKIIKELENI